tara:strand:- start:792 stop:1163 length:372 start_codon:yes stop_codon:yes gene_type:complete
MPGDLLSTVTTIVPEPQGLRMENGDADDIYQLSFLEAGAACIPYTTTVGWLPAMEWRWTSSWYYISPVGLGLGNGNGEWRRCSWIAAHAAGSRGSSTLYWGAVSGVMDNVEWSTEHGNIYSAL